jgi:phospholipase/carboxylesterase
VIAPDEVRPEALTRFVHRYVPARAGLEGSHVTLLLLHGTGGDENDLLQLGEMVSHGAAMLSPRGRVLEGAMPRFFRRLREGVFDVSDLKARAAELAEFVVAARAAYRLGDGPVVAVGFSNGANIAGGLLLGHGGTLQGAALLRPMVPYEPEKPPRLSGVPVLIAAGDSDPYGTPDEIARLEAILAGGGAKVTTHREPSGHNLTRGDVDVVRAWLEREFSSGKG